MALVIIDRSLDLATPISHQDHFLDGAAALLQRRPAAAAPQHVKGQGRWAFHR